MLDYRLAGSPRPLCLETFIWQKDLFSVACYICACMKLHATLSEEEDPNQPSWG